MSSRFGRNKKRKLKAEIKELEQALLKSKNETRLVQFNYAQLMISIVGEKPVETRIFDGEPPFFEKFVQCSVHLDDIGFRECIHKGSKEHLKLSVIGWICNNINAQFNRIFDLTGQVSVERISNETN